MGELSLGDYHQKRQPLASLVLYGYNHIQVYTCRWLATRSISLVKKNKLCTYLNYSMYPSTYRRTLLITITGSMHIYPNTNRVTLIDDVMDGSGREQLILGKSEVRVWPGMASDGGAPVQLLATLNR